MPDPKPNDIADKSVKVIVDDDTTDDTKTVTQDGTDEDKSETQSI